MEENSRVLYPNEIESYLESVEIFDVSEIGSAKWFQQQDRIYKLSLQAFMDVKAEAEEIIKEEIAVQQKVPVLIHELIATELWRLKIFPFIIKSELISKSTIPIYIVLYHEVTLVSFFETILFHEDVMESAGDTLIDLVDYCYRRIMTLKSLDSKENAEDNDDIKRILEQKRAIDFESGMKCISILSCMAHHKKIIPLSVLHRLLVVHDVPLLFTDLIYEPPWVRQENEEYEKYQDGKWKKVIYGELLKLNKVEGQLWLALIQLLLDPDCQKKYDMSGFRKDQILKLRSKINDVLLDQIPVLNEVLRYLEHLSLFDAPAPKSGIVIEQIPEIWESIQEKNQNKWKNIANRQIEEFFSFSETELQDFCKRLSASFDLKNIEAMLSDTPVCANCHEKGEKRCSRCKNEWYCGRSCQVTHWDKHKPACDLMTNKT